MMFGQRERSIVAASSYEQAVLSDAPTNYWRLSETSGLAAADLGSAPIEGTFSGAVLNQGALVSGGNSVLFDGGAIMHAGRPNTTSFSERTLELVFSADSFVSSLMWEERGRYGWGLGFYSNTLRATSYNGSNSACTMGYATSNLSLDTVYHVVVTMSTANTQAYLYVNGEQVAYQSGRVAGVVQNTAYGYAVAGGNQLIYTSGCGDVLGNGTTCRPYSGRLAEIAVYNTVLSPARVLAHFNASGI